MNLPPRPITDAIEAHKPIIARTSSGLGRLLAVSHHVDQSSGGISREVGRSSGTVAKWARAAKWARDSTNPTFVSAPWEETLAQFDMPVPPQDIEADGFKGFLPSTWSEEALKEIPDEILGVYDVAVMWNGEKTMTIEKDCLRWNGGRLTPSAVWCLRTDGILDFRLRFTTFCPGQKTVWVKRGSQQGVIESMDIHFQVNDTDGEATEFEGLFRRQGGGRSMSIPGRRESTLTISRRWCAPSRTTPSLSARCATPSGTSRGLYRWQRRARIASASRASSTCAR